MKAPKTPKLPAFNPTKDNFHAIVQQKKKAGVPGVQAIASTYAKAFPGQTAYNPGGGDAEQRKTSPLKGIRPKKAK